VKQLSVCKLAFIHVDDRERDARSDGECG
jgi:hypothetical protein